MKFATALSSWWGISSIIIAIATLGFTVGGEFTSKNRELDENSKATKQNTIAINTMLSEISEIKRIVNEVKLEQQHKNSILLRNDSINLVGITNIKGYLKETLPKITKDNSEIIHYMDLLNIGYEKKKNEIPLFANTNSKSLE